VKGFALASGGAGYVTPLTDEFRLKNMFLAEVQLCFVHVFFFPPCVLSGYSCT
jgi:hypothetical protein